METKMHHTCICVLKNKLHQKFMWNVNFIMVSWYHVIITSTKNKTDRNVMRMKLLTFQNQSGKRIHHLVITIVKTTAICYTIRC